MQSGKPSKKSLKKEEEKLGEVAPVSKTPKVRSARPLKAAKEKIETTSGKVHRKSPVTSSLQVEAIKPGLSNATATGIANGGVVDSVAIVAAAPRTEALVPAPAAQSKLAISREEIANLAYSYWEARGFAHGLADEDWIRAEAELLGRG